MLRSLVFLLDRVSKASALFRLLGPLAVVAVAAFAFWQLPSEPEAPSDPERTELAREVCAEVPPKLPPSDVEQRTLVLPFENDDTLRVTTAVRDALRPDNGQYVSVKDDVLRQAHNKWLHLWGTHQEAIGIDDVEQAAARAEKVGARFAVTGRVQKATPEHLTFELALIQVADRKEVARSLFSNAPPAEESAAGDLDDEASTSFAGSRAYLIGVLVFAFLWPLSLVAVIRKVLDAENNGLSLLTLVVIAGVPIALAYPWAMGAHRSLWYTVGYVVASLVVVLWSIFVMSKVAETVKY